MNNKPLQIVHQNHVCDGCKTKPIIGTRFKCSVCPDFDYCEKCKNTIEHAHKFIEFKVPQDDNANIFIKGLQYVKTNLNNLFSNQQQQQQMKPPVDEKKNININNSNNNNNNIINLGGKNIQYKAALCSEPKSVIEIEPKTQYQWTVELKNSGQDQWPQNISLYCTSGIYQGMQEKVNSLNKDQVMQINLSLQSPEKEGKNIICWRLGYQQDTEIKYFGPKISYELKVVMVQENVKQSGIICNQADQGIFKCNKQILEKASQLKEVLGGDVKTYIDYIQQSHLENISVEELVCAYVEVQKKQ